MKRSSECERIFSFERGADMFHKNLRMILLLHFPRRISREKVVALIALFAVTAMPVPAVQAGEPQGFLETVHRHITCTSTVTDNGDLNPYAIVIAPVSAGRIQRGDVLVDNFNNL